MSWKSFVTAGLLCVLASPAFAAPTVQIVPGGTFANNHLDANGNWVWKVRLSQSNPIVDVDGAGPITPGSPLAAELGFSATGSGLLSASVNATDFDDPNPGNVIFGWETLTNLMGTGDCDSPTPGNCPVGLQTNLTTDQVFAAFGSVDYLNDSDGKDFLTIITDGPLVGSLASTLTMRGTYGAGNNMGRIAELGNNVGAGTPSFNYDTYAGAFARTAQEGDADLNGVTNFFDLQTLLGNYNTSGKQWYHGDSTGDGTVNFFDLQALLSKYNVSYSVGPGAGAGGGGAVPEPASAVLALLACAGLYVRRAR
jgi:hypothetical protein